MIGLFVSAERGGASTDQRSRVSRTHRLVSLFALLIAAAAQSSAAGATASAQSFVTGDPKQIEAPVPPPKVDHHLHLMSPAAAALLNRVEDPAEPIPSEIKALLDERERAWDDPARLARLYAPGASVLSADDPVFYGVAEGAKYLGTRFARPIELTPRAFRRVGQTAHLAGFYTRGSGDELRRIGYFYMRLVRTGGRWRIASEVPIFPGPAGETPIPADRMITLLDEAGIQKAVILSVAYWFQSAFRPDAPDSYERLKAENDWTATEAARYPDRLVAFCSFNPLREQALEELTRCASGGRWKGIKLHLGSSGVDLTKAEHAQQLRRVFAAANAARLPIVIHLRGGDNYGAEHARVFLNDVLPAAPDVVVQVAHLWGGANYSREALTVYADTVATGHPATRNLYFDVTDAALVAGGNKQMLEEMAAAMRKIGLNRILYGSDAPIDGHPPPKGSWEAFRDAIPLTKAELATIASNIAPYLR